MHLKHPNRYTIARWRSGIGFPLLLLVLAFASMYALIPIATGAGLLASVLAWTIIVIFLAGAVFL